jgi:hypothetical protein
MPRSSHDLMVLALGCSLLGGCIDSISQGGRQNEPAAETGDGGAPAADAGPVGEGCGTDPETGLTLCLATSLCPTVVVDPQALPGCGFRLHGGAVDLICACYDSICSMGAFATCAQAAQLLETQSQATVCAQVAEERCATVASPGEAPGGGTCDRQCIQECGGGAGCAQVCGC